MNIVTICLSVVAITIGVFSIKQASLGVNGSVGFVAHECKVNISAYMYGYATSRDGYPIEKPTTDAEKHYLTYGSSNTEATESKPLMVYDDQNSGLSFNINSGNGVYFSNMSATNVVEPIAIVLTITNGTQNYILVEDKTTVATGAKYTVDCDNGATMLNYTQDNKSTTVKYILMPAKDSNGKYVDIETMVSVSLSMNFSKIDTTNINTDNFTISGTNVTGVPTKAQTGSDILVIPSVIKGIACTSIGDSPENRDDYRIVIVLDGYTSLDMLAFGNCTNIERVILPDTIANFSYAAFQNCSLKSVNIPKNITTITSNTFSGCSNLVSITISNGVTTISTGAFIGCRSLEKIEIPTSVTKIGSSAFSGTKITKYKFLKGVTYGTSVFTNLIEAELEYGKTSVGDSLFANCTSLTSVILPSTITSIEFGAFSGCTSLTSITIPSSVVSIYINAFDGCTSLTSVKFESTTGWHYGTKGNPGYYEFTSSELSNTSTAAEYLTVTYKGNIWSKS